MEQMAGTRESRPVKMCWQLGSSGWHQTRPHSKPFKPPLKQEIWKDLKEWLLTNVFYERCAYCESPLEFDRYLGDAEHYRPKGSVTWKKDLTSPKVKARCNLPDGSEIDHPGYFWLAYDWWNLVPACSACNSGAGKVDQFPVRSSHLLQLDIAQLAGALRGPYMRTRSN